MIYIRNKIFNVFNNHILLIHFIYSQHKYNSPILILYQLDHFVAKNLCIYKIASCRTLWQTLKLQ